MLTFERAHQLLALDVETGVLTRRLDSVPGRGIQLRAGDRAGYVHKASGYRYVGLDGNCYREHVLIWFMLHGKWLPRKIDHVDRDRANNRPTNLRVASESQQHMNTKVRSDNATGFRGVSKHPLCEKFQAEVRMGGKKFYLGLFHTAEEAGAVARAERLKLFGEHAPSYDL